MQIACAVKFAESGAKGTRTPDLLLAKEAFSQLNYGPLAHFRFQIFDFRFEKSKICNLKSKIPKWAFVESNHRPCPYQRHALTN